MHEEMGGGKEEKMSVLVKGMEMPKRCEDCPLCHYMEAGTITACGCKATMMIRPVGEQFRPCWCPLIEIQPHGDLIDRDELLSQYGGPIWTAKTDYAEGLRDVVADIKNAPTIIPAEPCNDLAKPNNAPTVIEAEGRE